MLRRHDGGGFWAGSLGNTPYLKIRKDTLNGSYACRASPHFDWASTFDAGVLASALDTDPSTSPGSHLRDMRVIRYDSSDRAEYLLIDGDRERQVDAYACWNGLPAGFWHSTIPVQSWAKRGLKIHLTDRNLPAWRCVY